MDIERDMFFEAEYPEDIDYPKEHMIQDERYQITERLHSSGFDIEFPNEDAVPPLQHMEAYVASLLEKFKIRYVREVKIRDVSRTDGSGNSPYDFLIAIPREKDAKKVFALIELDGKHHFKPSDRNVSRVMQNFFEEDPVLFMNGDVNDPIQSNEIYDISQEVGWDPNLFFNEWIYSREKFRSQISIDRNKCVTVLKAQIPFLRIASEDSGVNYVVSDRILATFVNFLRRSEQYNPIIIYSSYNRYLHVLPSDKINQTWFLNLIQVDAELRKAIQENRLVRHNSYFPNHMELESPSNYPGPAGLVRGWLSSYPPTQNQVTEARLFGNMIM